MMDLKNLNNILQRVKFKDEYYSLYLEVDDGNDGIIVKDFEKITIKCDEIFNYISPMFEELNLPQIGYHNFIEQLNKFYNNYTGNIITDIYVKHIEPKLKIVIEERMGYILPILPSRYKYFLNDETNYKELILKILQFLKIKVENDCYHNTKPLGISITNFINGKRYEGIFDIESLFIATSEEENFFKIYMDKDFVEENMSNVEVNIFIIQESHKEKLKNIIRTF